MQFPSVCHLGIGAICAILLPPPTIAVAQSLLEAWALAHYHEAIPIERFQAAAEAPPEDPAISKVEAGVWLIIDEPNCILRSNHPSGTAIEYYLNNILESHPTIHRSDGTFQIDLMGETPILCDLTVQVSSATTLLHLLFQAPDGIARSPRRSTTSIRISAHMRAKLRKIKNFNSASLPLLGRAHEKT